LIYQLYKEKKDAIYALSAHRQNLTKNIFLVLISEVERISAGKKVDLLLI
jgi:hypothetical protein